ncbi:MAG TPA: HAMP domain-containing sensor histidine kinase [Chryseolinea sp.]|nr:HAMP domain-containing sensor histidine kinase [Chryseolinea sp.]
MSSENAGMNSGITIRNLIIGKTRYIDSYVEYKRVMVSGKLALLYILVCLGYIAYDLPTGNLSEVPVLGATILLLALTICYHRHGDHKTGHYCLLTTVNCALYLVASSESPNSSALIFFLVNTIAAFAILSYQQRLHAILFAVFTYTLFVLSYFVDYSLLPERRYDEETLVYFMILNFSAALPAAILSVNLLVALNRHSALKLVENTDLLMKTNAELDRFVYSTSHDLRAPLSSVMGLINITEKSREPEEVVKYLGMMRDRVMSLDRFIRDITDYSRNNRLEVKREKVYLRCLIDDIWESLKFSSEAETIQFRNDIPEQLFIHVDRGRLQVVLGNLISNAMRYQDSNKNDPFILVEHYITDNIFCLKVADNGQGIPKEYHTKVFDMFFRANEKSKGSGLGLYIVKEAIMKLSGSIHLDSEPTAGSTFTIRLPL